jgi:drug/metabolite transporter (DMT)-like permease
MKTAHIAIVLLYACAMGVGQILFKNVAVRGAALPMSFTERLLFLATDITFILAALFYALLTIVWIWILSFIPLSRAFPFTFMSVLVAGLGGNILFGEQLSANFYFGVTLVAVGLFVLSME